MAKLVNSLSPEFLRPDGFIVSKAVNFIPGDESFNSDIFIGHSGILVLELTQGSCTLVGPPPSDEKTAGQGEHLPQTITLLKTFARG